MTFCHVLSVLKCDEQDSEEAENFATWKPKQFTESPKIPWTPWPTQQVRHTQVVIKQGLPGEQDAKGQRASVSLGLVWDEGAFRG